MASRRSRARTRSTPEITVERAIKEENLPEHLGDGENELQVGYVRQHFVDHAFGPQDGSLLPATRTQPASFSTERHEELVLRFTIRVTAAQSEKPEVRVATADVCLHQIAHPGVERAVGPGEALVVDSASFLDAWSCSFLICG